MCLLFGWGHAKDRWLSMKSVCLPQCSAFPVISKESLCLHASCLPLIKEEGPDRLNLLGFSEWRWDAEVGGKKVRPPQILSRLVGHANLAEGITFPLAGIQLCTGRCLDEA